MNYDDIYDLSHFINYLMIDQVNKADRLMIFLSFPAMRFVMNQMI